jgi:hypothetical protein
LLQLACSSRKAAPRGKREAITSREAKRALTYLAGLLAHATFDHELILLARHCGWRELRLHVDHVLLLGRHCCLHARQRSNHPEQMRGLKLATVYMGVLQSSLRGGRAGVVYTCFISLGGQVLRLHHPPLITYVSTWHQAWLPCRWPLTRRAVRPLS